LSSLCLSFLFYEIRATIAPVHRFLGAWTMLVELTFVWPTEVRWELSLFEVGRASPIGTVERSVLFGSIKLNRILPEDRLLPLMPLQAERHPTPDQGATNDCSSGC
jgi:hypothetical protein